MTSVPLSGTNVRLLSGVPFYNDYKDTRWFANGSEQATYFLNKPVVHQIRECTFQRIEGRSFISVDQSIDELWGTNYVMFQNAHYSQKWFFGFITKLEYKNQHNTYVHFEIDVLQTWMHDITFKPSYVVREHAKLWETDGTPVRNTLPESLGYGNEYETVFKAKYMPYEGLKWLVVVTNSAIHYAGSGTPGDTTDDVKPGDIVPTFIGGVPQPLSYYLLPYYKSGKLVRYGSQTLATPEVFLKQASIDTDAVKRIVSMYVSDFPGIKAEVTSGVEYNTIVCEGVGQTIEGTATGVGGYCLFVKQIDAFYPLKQTILTDKYSECDAVFESKLLMYPYTVGVLDDFKGNRMEFKLENINRKEFQLLTRGATGTSNKVTYGICDYNDSTMASGEEGTQYLSLEKALIDSDPNDIPVISEYLSAYLQGHKNTIATQKESAMFRAVSGAVQGGAGMSAAGPVGAVAGATAGAVQGMANAYYEIKGINAQLEDMSNMPPSMSKMGSNIAYDYGNNYDGVYLLIKQIKSEHRNKLAHFFNMFGYATNEVKVPNFHTRQYWNYIKTSGCTILSNVNNEDLQELKSIFNNGITLWHTDDVGNYALTNGVI